MNRMGMVVRHPAAAWAAHFVFWLAFFGLIAFAASGCSTFGIATEEYVEDRVEAVTEARIETAAAIVAPLEPVVPGITEYARETAKGVIVRAPPPPAPTDWGAIALAVLGSIGLGTPIAAGVTNHMRDRRRRQQGEATTVAEAKAKGYFDDAARA